MKFFAVGLAIFLAVLPARVSAADEVNSTLLACGLNCIVTYTSQSSCELTNTTCICLNQELNQQITACVTTSCNVREQLTVQRYSMESCGVKSRDKRRLVAVSGVIFGVIAVIVTCLRVLSKCIGTGGTFGMDDYCLIAATCIEVPFFASTVVLANHGLGMDIWAVSFADIQAVLYKYFWGELMYLALCPLTKMSILFFYLRIFPRKEFKYWVYGTMAACVGYFIAFELVSIFQCAPLDGAWKHWDGDPKYKCNNINLQGWMSATWNIVLDVAIMLLPMPELWKLSMSWKKKVQLMMMFSVGIFVTIVSILRLKSLIQFGATHNPTYDFVDLCVWSNIEVPVSIICACMPSLRSLLRRIFPKAFGTTDKGDSKVLSDLPKVHKLSQRGMKLTSRPNHPDGDSFVQLVELDSKGESKT